jgi:hypothetical protein
MRAEFILEHQCPQCGAGVNLPDTDRIFSCAYCKAKLLVIGYPYCSYYLKPSAGTPNDLFYVPYWRFKGTHWILNTKGIHHTLVDQSVCAASFPYVQQTLGIRSQSIVMKFVQPLSEGIFLNAQVNCETARTKLFPSMSTQARLAGVFLNGECAAVSETPDLPTLTAFTGEAISLVYAPHYIHDRILHDGISLSALGPVQGDLPEMADSRPRPPIFVSALCPVCGWDCLAERDSLVLLCSKCNKAWIGRNNALESLDIQISPGYEPGDIHIPFWRFDIVARQIPLETYGDLVRLTNLPRAVLPGMESQKLFFWIPAFKSNPALFLRLGKLMTINQKPENYVSTLPAADYYPVTLSAEEGFKAVSIVLGDIGSSRKALLPLLEENSFDLISSTLVYVPFTHARGEFIQKSLNFALQSNALKWGRFL